jgi:hypothetical protein
MFKFIYCLDNYGVVLLLGVYLWRAGRPLVYRCLLNMAQTKPQLVALLHDNNIRNSRLLLPRPSTTPPRHRSTTPPRHRSTTPPRQRSTTPPRHRSTTPPRHRSTTPMLQLITPPRANTTPSRPSTTLPRITTQLMLLRTTLDRNTTLRFQLLHYNVYYTTCNPRPYRGSQAPLPYRCSEVLQYQGIRVLYHYLGSSDLMHRSCEVFTAPSYYTI